MATGGVGSERRGFQPILEVGSCRTAVQSGLQEAICTQVEALCSLTGLHTVVA